jgi:hypothetical protein
MPEPIRRERCVALRAHDRAMAKIALDRLALQALDNVREQQASALAYFDCFWVFAMIMLCARATRPVDEALGR